MKTAFWGKSNDFQRHDLAHHMLDVAAVAIAILDQEPESTRQWIIGKLGLSPENFKEWIALIVAFHDFGKATPGFIAKNDQGMDFAKKAGLNFTATLMEASRHDISTSVLLTPLLRGFSNASRSWCNQMVAAISAHHGSHISAGDRVTYQFVEENPQWNLERQKLFNLICDAIHPKGSPAAERIGLDAINWFAGFTSCADWIASNEKFFPYGSRGHSDIRGYWDHACSLARSSIQKLGWHEFKPLLDTQNSKLSTDELISQMVGVNLKARLLQQSGDALLCDPIAKGPALMLVEAPMGEGKTEMAFLAHLRLQRQNQHRGMYVALPTQATGNAMFSRVVSFLRRYSHGSLDIQLAHSGAQINEEVIHLRSIAGSKQESISASEWFSQRKRPLLSPNGVGTVDQALSGVMATRHHFVRLFGLSNRVVILDEIHAYDTYTSGLITALLQWLKAMGSSVVLMSATLPRDRQLEFLSAWGIPKNDVPLLSYPRIVVADSNGLRWDTFDARPLNSITLKGIGCAEKDVIDSCVKLVENGGCGAVIVNTVYRAQTIYKALKEHFKNDVELILFHARYPADERLVHEKNVMSTFGKKDASNSSKIRPHKAIMIATQVAEQSLDIDFDFMITDLAPVDLLLQRSGRLHRHSNTRLKEHEEAVLWVSGLQSQIPDIKNTAWGVVYDPYILLRTWALLKDVPVLEMPKSIDYWVQRVYGDEPLPEDLEKVALDAIEIESFGKHLAAIGDQRIRSLNACISPEDTLENYASKQNGVAEGEGRGLELKTRLGDESLTLIPVIETMDGWKIFEDSIIFDPHVALEDGLAKKLYNRQVKTSNKTLIAKLKNAQKYECFNHPLLRNFSPMIMKNGVFELENLNVFLDIELGLIYEKK